MIGDITVCNDKLACFIVPIFCLSQVQLPLSQRGHGAKDQQGCIIIIAEELVALKDEIVMQFRGTKLDKMHFFGKSNPFLVFYKSLESGEYVVVHKTEVNIAVVPSELGYVVRVASL
jgi:hypothetical protein